MKLNQKDTALLVFSLSAEKEIERKHIFDKNFRNENTAFFNILIDQTRRLAEQSGVDVFWVDEHHQTGKDFSTRFTNAFQELFDAGYKNVVSIGNDCPDLTVQLLKEAIQKLGTKKLILGPSRDGGIYLLGIHRDVFDKNDFLMLPWQTSALQKSLKNHFNGQKNDCEVLSELEDLDSGKDALHYANINTSTVLGRFILVIGLSTRSVFPISNDFIPSSNRYSYVGLRAPPTV
ncbi:TIGR04282 family arsenosugar biosynthesis glycosyltransferase [Maribacter litoralis]|uniref:TIGR04282 family arsenosugar biosynthesis glycosyltransferase n=1 Tax=Maribacter litoralis TaxID=2059726 RepID=UPI003F5CDC9B